MGYFVPATLQKFNNWVLWDKSKRPFSAKYNGLASPVKPYQWASYDEAIRKLEYTDDYCGVGFIFSDNCGLVFIDLDHCIDEDSGELTAFASNIVEAFSGTYIEYSQSGSGLHIVCKGTIPEAFNKRNGFPIEIYSTARHMAFTGNAYEAAEPADKQAELNRLCSFLNMKKREQPEQIRAEQDITADDQEALKRCEKWKDFQQLYYSGAHTYTKASGELDDSRADYRLCFILLSCCNGNREQAERLFMQSRLAERKKCRRADYISRTMEAAARNLPTQEQRQQIKRKQSRPANNRPQPKTYTKQEETINGLKVY